MKSSERLLNICFGLSLIYWGIAGFLTQFENFNTSRIRLFITVLNITVGFLIIFRNPIIKKGSIYSIIISLPSLISGGLLFKLSKPLFLWHFSTEILFVFGGFLTFISFLFLGRNFSIFPEIREVVSNGVFKFIRHPSYLGETIMVTASLISAENYISIIPFIIFILGLIFRINEEEHLLKTDINYQIYIEKVKWRLIPFVW